MFWKHNVRKIQFPTSAYSIIDKVCVVSVPVLNVLDVYVGLLEVWKCVL